MSKQITIAGLFLLLSWTTASAQLANPGAGASDTLGDIRYSILEPDAFYTIHGAGKWVLLDGRSIQGSKLYELGVHKIPDARGMFIRSMDMGRNSIDGRGDPEWQTRNVTDPQMDNFKRHNHGMRHWHGVGDGGGQELTMNAGPPFPLANDTQEGGDETRPRNIALYVYIKIN